MTVENWEFLLQKQGDSAWLLLDTLYLEVEEGKYHIAGRCRDPQCEIEVRLAYRSVEENAPKHYSHNQLLRPDSTGWVDIMVAADLKAGLWELRCRSDEFCELAGEFWQQTLYLQVYPVGELTGQSSEDPLTEAANDTAVTPEPTQQPEIASFHAGAGQTSEVLGKLAPPDVSVAWEQSWEQTETAAEADLEEAVWGQLEGSQPQFSSACGQAPSTDHSPSQQATPTSDAEDALLNRTQDDALLEDNSKLELATHELAASALDLDIPLASGELDRPTHSENALVATEKGLIGPDKGWSPQTPANSEISAAKANLRSQLLDDLEQILEQTFDSLLPTLTHVDEAEHAPNSTGSYQIALAQEVFTGQRGASILLFGRIDAEGAESSGSGWQLRIRLRDPQTALILLEGQLALPEQPLPLVFSEPIALPNECETHVLLGEVSLEAPSAEKAQVLARKSFTVCLDWEQVFETVRSTPSESTDASAASCKLPATLNSPELMQKISCAIARSRGDRSQVLPPKLPKTPRPKPTKSPQLPKISPSSSQSAHASPAAQESSHTQAPSTPASQPSLSREESLAALEHPGDIWSSHQDKSASTAANSSAPYWEEIPELRIIASDQSSPQVSTPLETTSQAGESASAAVATAHEHPSQPTQFPKGHTSQPATAAWQQQRRPTIGQPVLDIAQQELTAGQPLVVRVLLPAGVDSIYVKLWVRDPQTRTLLDGPRALVDFAPNWAGTLESVTQLIVPVGCVEVRFEAIALDWKTKAESYKTVIDRVVMPPKFPDLL